MGTRTIEDEKDDADPQIPITGDEGPRSFARFLATLAGGEAEAETSYQFHELCKAIQIEVASRHAKAKGTITVRINVTGDIGGGVAVGYTVDRKDPKRTTTPAVKFFSAGGNLIDENPRQQKLKLRDAGGGKVETRDIGRGVTNE